MDKAKLITIKRDEARAYESLREMMQRAEPLRFVLAVLASRPVIIGDPEPQKWFVPSASRAGEFHVVDIDLRVCDCAGWSFKHHCSHLAIADRAVRLRYELTTAPAMPVGDFGPHPSRERSCAR